MINKAIAKITDEMMKSKSPAIRHIEEHLTECVKSTQKDTRLNKI